MKKFLLIICAIISSSVALAGCGGGGGAAAPTPPPTAATTKVFLFGTMSSASAGGSAGIMDSVSTTIPALPAGVTLTSIVSSGPVASGILNSDVSSSFDAFTGDLIISLLNSNQTAVIANTTGKGVEVATLNFSLTDVAVPIITTPGTATTVFQYRTGPLSVKELNGCVINFVTTYH